MCEECGHFRVGNSETDALLAFVEEEKKIVQEEALGNIEEELAEIIVDAEGLVKFPVGSVELHTTIGGNAGTRRAIEIVRKHLSPSQEDTKRQDNNN